MIDLCNQGRAVHREYDDSWSDRCLSVTTVDFVNRIADTFFLTGTTMAKTLNELVAFLDGLEGRAPLQELVAELAELRVGCEELREHVRFSDKQYARNLVRKGRGIICWFCAGRTASGVRFTIMPGRPAGCACCAAS